MFCMQMTQRLALSAVLFARKLIDLRLEFGAFGGMNFLRAPGATLARTCFGRGLGTSPSETYGFTQPLRPEGSPTSGMAGGSEGSRPWHRGQRPVQVLRLRARSRRPSSVILISAATTWKMMKRRKVDMFLVSHKSLDAVRRHAAQSRDYGSCAGCQRAGW